MLGKKRMSKSIRESSGIKFCLCQAHEKPKEDKSKKRPVGRPRRSGVKVSGLTARSAKKTTKTT